MTSDLYINLSSRNATKISESTYQWDLPLPLQLEAKAQFECGLIRAVIPSFYKGNLAPAGIIKYKMSDNDEIQNILWDRFKFVALDDLIRYLNGSLNDEISDLIVFEAIDTHVNLEVGKSVEFVEVDESFGHFLGFGKVHHFKRGQHLSPSPARLSMFSNELSVYTDFTVGRICNQEVAPLLASFVLPDTGQYLESITFNHIEYMGLTRLDLRTITMTINHSNENEPFVWYNPMNHYLSFTLHLRRANLLFDI